MKLIGHLLPFCFGTAVWAANHIVQVAPRGSLIYDPNNVTAAVGDTVEFQFDWANHSVAQADFSNPCHPIDGGIWSGFVLTPATTFTVTVNDTDPTFFYCAQSGHCQVGMVFAINPNDNETLDAFETAAENTTGVAPHEPPQGGILSTPPAPSSTPSNSTAHSGGSIKAINFILLLGPLAMIFMI